MGNYGCIEKSQEQLLREIAEKGNVSQIKDIGDRYINIINEASDDLTGRTPLMIAAYNGNIAAVEYFIEMEACMDQRCIDNKTALHYSAMKNNGQICDILLNSHETPAELLSHRSNVMGYTALEFASGHPKRDEPGSAAQVLQRWEILVQTMECVKPFVGETIPPELIPAFNVPIAEALSSQIEALLGCKDRQWEFLETKQDVLPPRFIKGGKYISIEGYYSISRRVRGIAFVIGNGNFGNVQSACRRDSFAMAKVLKETGYRVINLYNLSTMDIKDEIRKVQEMSHETFDSFIFYFSGHGANNEIYGHSTHGAKDVLNIDLILNEFQPLKCPGLSNKPKIFLWDCCRHDDTNGGFGKSLQLASTEKATPKYLHFLCAYASAPESKSFIGDDTTSYLSIWTYFLTQRLEANVKTERSRKQHLADLLTDVQNDVRNYGKKYPKKQQVANNVSFLVSRMALG